MKSVVFVHAHPDDEAILSGGTLRALHQRGFRTVVIFLTNGERGLSKDLEGDSLGNVRQQEAKQSARILGVSSTYFLEYSDSGLESPSGQISHSLIPIDEACEQVRKILEIEQPVLLVGYDQQGGYGHPDHKAVHSIVKLLAGLIDIPNILEVTVDRAVIALTLEKLRYLIAILEKLRLVKAQNVYALADSFSATADISYSVNVRRFTSAKQSAIKVHVSQSLGGLRNLKLMALLPPVVFKYFFGREWFSVIRENSDNPLKTLIS